MLEEVSLWWTWVILVVLMILFLTLVATGWWLLRRRKRHEMRAEAADELRETVRGLGIGVVWQAPLFQADIFGLRGTVDEFEIRAEIWDKSGHDFIRVSIYFPRSIQQDLRLRLRNNSGLATVWRNQEVSVGEERFDESFGVYTRPNRLEEVKEIFNPALRRRLMALVDKVDDLKLGDRSLYVLVDGDVKPSELAPVIRDCLKLSQIFFERGLEQLPSGGARNTQYEMAAEDVLGRESRAPLSTGALPEGTQSADECGGSDEDTEEEKEE